MSVTRIEIARPYQESCNFAGMTGSGKSNALAYAAQKLPREITYTLFDLVRVHKWQPLNPKKQRIIHPSLNAYVEELEVILEQVFREGNHVLMIEEIDRFSTLHVMPERLDDIINVGRNRRVSLWLSFRRPQRVHKDLIENAYHHFIFRMFGTACEWYKEATGWRGVEEAKNLLPYHFIYWKVGQEPQFCKPLPKVL